jgi:hypothetical protein
VQYFLLDTGSEKSIEVADIGWKDIVELVQTAEVDLDTEVMYIKRSVTKTMYSFLIVFFLLFFFRSYGDY